MDLYSLDGAHLEVTSATPVPSTTAPATLPAGSTADTPIGASLEQEDKPKAGIVAECELCFGDAGC